MLSAQSRWSVLSWRATRGFREVGAGVGAGTGTGVRFGGVPVVGAVGVVGAVTVLALAQRALRKP
ncbi:hypothetical protein [Streptomyces sp. MBT53]|uniref:hypothetical protein n=1 Tax=Streptomyces sp. MBT53 TaxID=1488384 RepID=UPI0035AB72FE